MTEPIRRHEINQMPATQILRNNHKIMRGLMRQLETLPARAPEMKEGVIREFLMQWEMHSRLEQEIFYPALEQSGDFQLLGLVRDSRDVHQSMSDLVTQFRRLAHQGESFEERLEDLIIVLQNQIEKEESGLFPLADRYLRSRNQEINEWLRLRREKIMASPRYKKARANLVQNPHGGEQKRKSAA